MSGAKIRTRTASARHQRRLGIKKVDDRIWLMNFMQHDPGYIDPEQRTLQTIDNPFGTRLSPLS
jgi:hypothetical protein